MREIKFRAWLPVSSQMNNSVGITNTGAVEIFPGLVLGDIGNGLPIIMQYTGLKDKNGKESFHKDIVEEPDGRRYTVEWNEDEGRWELQSIEHVAGTHYVRHFKDIKIMKIMGNYYENPELLDIR